MSLRAAIAFAHTLRRTHWKTRAQFDAWQRTRLARWLRQHVPTVPEFQAIEPDKGIFMLPTHDKRDILDRFERFNCLGLTRSEAMEIADGAPAPSGYFVGSSTGTSGPRQPYLISDAERQVWLGTILAKTLGWTALRRPRVAVVLPRGSALYDAAAKRLPLCFVPITDGFAAMGETLASFRPDILVAPPRALRWLAEERIPMTPTQIFSAAEVLDPVDRQAIAIGFPQAQFGEIYMATEGLLATTCRHGTLHLAEDCMFFEFEEVAPGLVTPLISDFSRSAQIMARYRMNDLLRLGPPCPCGSVLRTIKEIEGRCDDVFDIGGVLITPDILRNAVLSQDGISDFRVFQTGPRQVELCLPPGSPSAAEAIRTAIRRAGGEARIIERFAPMVPSPERKLRRVERVWNAD